jgi:hypothetical protein
MQVFAQKPTMLVQNTLGSGRARCLLAKRDCMSIVIFDFGDCEGYEASKL